MKEVLFMVWKHRKYLETSKAMSRVDKYPNASILKENFSFLNDYNFEVVREDSLNYGSYVEYKGNGLKIYLGFDFKGYDFSFDLYKSDDLKYSDVAYGKAIISFCNLAKEMKIDYDCSKLQPDKGYSEALLNNVTVLKEYIQDNIKQRTL